MSGKIIVHSSNMIKEEFRQKIWRQSKSESMVNYVNIALVMFERFCEDSYKKNSTDVIEELKKDLVEVQKEGKGNQKLYLFLDNFVQWLSDYKPQKNQKKDQLAPTTIRGYFSTALKYLRHNGISISNDSLREFVVLPKKHKELPQPITRDEIEKIIENADEKRRVLYLTLVSSGIRIGEALQLRKKYFSLQYEPARIVLPSKITKTREARIVFVSREVKEKLTTTLLNLQDDDLVFTKTDSVRRAEYTEENYFSRLRKKVGLTEFEYSGNRHKVTIHKFRKFFAIHAERKLGLQISGSLLGHSPYMKTYYEYDSDELGKMYAKLEPDLIIAPEYRQKMKIKNQQDEIEELKRRELEIKNLKSKQVDDKKEVLDMISKLVDDPKKFKEILKKSKN